MQHWLQKGVLKICTHGFFRAYLLSSPCSTTTQCPQPHRLQRATSYGLGLETRLFTKCVSWPVPCSEDTRFARECLLQDSKCPRLQAQSNIMEPAERGTEIKSVGSNTNIDNNGHQANVHKPDVITTTMVRRSSTHRLLRSPVHKGEVDHLMGRERQACNCVPRCYWALQRHPNLSVLDNNAITLAPGPCMRSGSEFLVPMLCLPSLCVGEPGEGAACTNP